jgi:hypothetical protein
MTQSGPVDPHAVVAQLRGSLQPDTALRIHAERELKQLSACTGFASVLLELIRAQDPQIDGGVKQSGMFSFAE